MPDGSTKIFEDVRGIEEQDSRHLTFICSGTVDSLRSVTINLDLVIGFEIDGIIPQQSEDDDEPNEGED